MRDSAKPPQTMSHIRKALPIDEGRLCVALEGAVRQGSGMSLRIFLVVALTACCPVLAQDYEIRMSFPERVGQKTRLSITGHDQQAMSVWSGGKKVREQVKE